jgi:hypothetical protein
VSSRQSKELHHHGDTNTNSSSLEQEQPVVPVASQLVVEDGDFGGGRRPPFPGFLLECVRLSVRRTVVVSVTLEGLLKLR